MHKRYAAAVAFLVLAMAGAVAADALKSGPQTGDKVPGPFEPMNINGAHAGEKHCLFCQHGTSPVVAIFAREISEPLTTIIKKVDEVTGKNGKVNMGSYVVFCSDADGLSQKLKDLSATAKLKHLVLATYASAGPEDYKIAKDADVTILLYEDLLVKANHTFKKGELKDAEVKKVLSDLSKILPKN
jgi:hypothetical protein